MNETNEEKKNELLLLFYISEKQQRNKEDCFIITVHITCIAFFSFHYLLLNALHVDIWVMATQSSSLKHLSLLLWLFSSAPCPPHN